MSDDVQITGLRETQLMLQNLPAELTRLAVPRALRAGSEPIQAELHFNAPRRARDGNEEYEFPRLEDSIVTDIEVKGLSGVASTGFGEAGPVALFQEDGHRIVTHAGKDTGEVTEPNPFMARSTESIAEAAIDAFCESLLDSVRSEYAS